jgi:lysophospholipase L1-like esterase
MTQQEILNLINGTAAGKAAQLVNNYTGQKLYADSVCNMAGDGTIKGIGTPMGIRNNFNQVTVKMRSYSATNITSITWWVRTVDHSGAILDSGTIAVNIDNNVAGYDIVFNLNSTIANANNDQMFFEFLCNQTVVVQKNNTGTVLYPYPTYGKTSYYNFGSWNTTTTVQNYNVNVGLQRAIPSPSTDFLSEITRLYVDPIPHFSATAEIVLPSCMYAVVGTEMNAYFENFIFTNLNLSQYDIQVTCTKGNSYTRFWRYTPVAGDVGNTTFTITVLFNNVQIATATATLYTANSTVGSGITRKIINIGDSTTDAGVDTQTLTDYVSPLTIVPTGIRLTNTAHHEGRSGWSSSDFINNQRGNYYSLFVSGVTQVISTVTYTIGGVVYTVQDILISGGNGRINVSGASAPPASGTMTRTGSSGDASIVYSSWKTVAANPFWNLTTSQLDFANYLIEYGFSLSAGDWVRINLGINDIYNSTIASVANSLSLSITSVINNFNSLIAKIQTAVPGVRIAICLIHAPSYFIDYFGVANYQTISRYFNVNYKQLLQALITNFDTPTNRGNNIYVLGYNLSNDRQLNYPITTGNANARNTTQISYYAGGVHPATSGYQQMGESLYSLLKYMV